MLKEINRTIFMFNQIVIFMKKFFQKSLLLILLAFGGINAAFSYDNAGGYDGHFKFVDTYLSLDRHWISWRFPNWERDGIEEALKYSRWYIGGDANAYTKWNSNPSYYFNHPLVQGTEILYMERTYGIHQRQNEAYGVGNVHNLEYRGDVRTADIKFYPGELMGPTQMANFYVRWTGWWDYNDNGSVNNKDYWIGQGKGPIGSSTDGAYWQGAEKQHKGNGVERFYRITYDIPATNAATFTRRAGKKIEVSISGNDHGSWNEYYGFSDGTAVDGYGYYTNTYGTTSLSGGKATYTLNGTFDETQNHTIYYHQFYKRSQTIKGQESSHDKANTEERTVNQHFQASRISTVVKGFMYPSNLQVTQNKWDKSVKLTWTINNNDNNHNKDGGWLVFRQKKGETGYTLLTSTKLNNANSSYTDTNIETGAEYTYWVTFAPTSYGTVSEPIDSKLSASASVKHDNTFAISDVSADCEDGQAGIKITWTPEKTGNDVLFYIQRWDEDLQDWKNLKDVGQTGTSYIDTDVTSWEEYKYRIRTTYWNLEFLSAEVSRTYAVMTKVKEFTASQGTYSNMVKLNWNVTILSEGDTRYTIYRKLLGDGQGVFTKIYETVGKETSFYYEDMSAQPGQFYDYMVTASVYVPEKDGIPAWWATSNSIETDGFVQTRGILSGRIKYGTGTAVPNVKVVLVKSGDNDNTAKQFYSLHLDAKDDAGVEWKLSDEMIENYFTGNNRPWSIQMYMRPDAGMTGTQSIFDVNGYAGVGVAPATGGYELQVKSATGTSAATYSATGIMIPADEYTHLVFSYDGASTYNLRAIRLADEDENGIAFEEGKNLKTLTGKANVQFNNENRSRTVTFGMSGFKGYIDEMRVWTKVLTDKEVDTYHNRTLTCTEKNLLAYWPVDEGINGMHNVYDYSKTNGVANSNHALMNGVVLISEVVPTEEQLSIYSYTDENGNYVIRGVPFSGDGTTYLVRPTLGIHKFNPTYHTRYVSSNTLTHDNIEFEDVSSFKVTGVVYYENTTYPVQGCNLAVDGNLCSKEGKLIETDEQGRFEISVPIGDHYITIEKNGHTFTNEGRYPAGIGTQFTFDREVSGLTFYDNTLVNIAGRVVGGDIEGNKPVGFGDSRNNIGVTELVLTPVNDLYSLNAVTVIDGLTSRYENNTETLACASTTDLVNSTSWRGANEQARKIFIRTDAESGEFSALVPPLIYNVSAPVVVKTNTTVGEAGLVDLSNPNSTATDTITTKDGEVKEFEYNKKYVVVYHSEPSFTVNQSGFENGALGISTIDLEDRRGKFKVNIVNEEGKPEYAYGTPVFLQGDPYTFKLKGFEQYTNYDDDGEPVTSTVPLKECVVTIANALSDGQSVLVQVEENNEDYNPGDVVDLEPNELLLDENGEAIYTWKAGYPNITEPYSRTISMTYTIGGKVYDWTIDGKNFIEGVILGSIPTGSNFVTAGPDKLLMILRDPPGSGSSAEWSSGTVTTKEKTIGHQWSSETTIKDSWEFGVKAVTFHGIGTGAILSTDTKDEVTAGAKVVTEGENATTVSHSLTITETISTSDDPSMVGSMADVYVGYSSNLLFGKAREVNFVRDENDKVSLGVEDIISVGSQFDTKFMYTGYYIESYLIPNLIQIRNNKLITVTPEQYANYKNTTDELVYVTTLSLDDDKFGSDNNDKKVWGDKAVAVDAIEGPSYKIVLPERLENEEQFDNEIGKEYKADQDEVRWANMQISNWIKYLAQNEEEKVKAWEDRDGNITIEELGKDKEVKRLITNYSLDGGTSFTYSIETESTTTETHEHETGALAILGNKFGATFNKTGFTCEVETETGGKRHKNTSDGTSNTASFSFTLAEEGDDALTIDAYRSASYSPMFRTRGGQTSAPYEDEEYTKYYEPGKHKLHEKTMQIEVPDIEVEVATVSNITSGTAASYTLLLTNKSEIDCDLYYKLIMMDETNPNGAQLSIDGVALSDNRVIKVPAGEVVKKTLLLKQSNLGKLEYKNIGIVLASQSQWDPTGTFPQITDTVYISAYYVPSSSPVKMELNRTLLNTSSGANLDITFNSFDRNYYNLKAFRIQYMKQGDTDWTTLKEYLLNVSEGQQLSSLQMPLPETADVTYTLDMSSFADGKYTFRVLSASTYGTGESTLVTDAVEVTKDMARPMSFGTPKPTTGFLGVGDDIEITFNENINNGRLTSTGNFIVTAALNGQQVAHDVALKATGSENAVAMTDANYNFIGKGFAVDMWIRIDAEPTGGWEVPCGTFFSHGNGANKIELGIMETQQYFSEVDENFIKHEGWRSVYRLTVNGVSDGGDKYIPAGKWVYIAFSLDPEGNLSDAQNPRPAYSALMATDDQTVILAKNQEVYSIGDDNSYSTIEKYEGNGRIALGQGFTGAIQEVALWDEAIDVTNLQAQMHETKKPSTEHLIGYWKFNEGRGTQAQDLARNRHMTLDATSWYLNNQNKALDLAGDALYDEYDAVVINLSECSARNNDDYAVEMWFRAEKYQDNDVVYIFDTDAFGVALEEGKMVLNATQDGKMIMSMGNKKYNDANWHHLAINVLRSGNTIVYVDGEAVGQVASTNVPALQTSYMYLGAQRVKVDEGSYEMLNKLKGQIDEIRVWNATLNAKVLRERMYSRLYGTEPGLVAYYPFEEEKLDANMQVVTEGSAKDMVTNRHQATGYKNSYHEIACTDEAPALKPVNKESNVNYSFVASERGIVINLDEEANRIEGVTVNITVKDVLDLNGNMSLPISWTALVKRNQLLWFEDELDVVGRIGEEKKFTAMITNQSAQTEYWALNDLPAWLSANFTSGSLPALGNQEITFTVDASAPTGKSQFSIYMSGNNAILVPLTVNMNLKADAPDWTVTPTDYEGAATLMGAVMINMSEDTNGGEMNNVYSEDEDDLVGAFIDDKCVGVTNVMYDSYSDSYRIFLNIYGNPEDEDKEIKLMVWDASTGIVHPFVYTYIPEYEDENFDYGWDEGTTLEFYADATWGDFDFPCVVYATNYIQQSTPLNKNWNWISIYAQNINPEDKQYDSEINAVLKSIGSNGSVLKNQNASAEYDNYEYSWFYEEIGWDDEEDEPIYAGIPEVEIGEMYKLKMNAPSTLVIAGPACSPFTEITIKEEGWTWIPYLRSFSLSLDDAFAGIEPQRNDQVKGQNGFATYNGTAWSGTLKAINPGKGYVYRNVSGEEKYLRYPENRPVAAASLAPARRAVQVESMFEAIDPTMYEGNMTILAIVKDGDEIVEDVQEIAVFDGATCLATAMMEEDGYFYLTIPGDATMTNRLTMYVVVDGEIRETSTNIRFGMDATFGDYDNPFVAALAPTTAIDMMIASGNYSKLQVVDVSGRVLFSGAPTDFNKVGLNEGVYIFELVTSTGEIMYYKQLIKETEE